MGLYLEALIFGYGFAFQIDEGGYIKEETHSGIFLPLKSGGLIFGKAYIRVSFGISNLLGLYLEGLIFGHLFAFQI